MGLMSYIHNQLVRRGKLLDLMPDEVDFDSGDKPERDAVKADIEARAVDEQESRKEVSAAIRRLRELDKKNHYGESLRRAFEGR